MSQCLVVPFAKHFWMKQAKQQKWDIFGNFPILCDCHALTKFFIRNILFKCIQFTHFNDKITKVTRSYFPLNAPDKTPALTSPRPTPAARAAFSGGMRSPWDDPWCDVRRRPAFAKIFPLTAPRASPAPKAANAGLSGSGPGRAKTVEMAKTNKIYEKVKDYEKW